MPPATSSVTTASSMSSSDISLPSSPSASTEPSADPYAFSSSDEGADAAPPAKKRKPGGRTVGVRTWPAADEVVLLEAVAAHKEQHGRLPKRGDLPAALAGRLPHVTAEQVSKRVHVLRARYDLSVRNLRRGTVPVTDDDVRIFRLSKRIWEGVPKQRRPRAAPHHERREFAELEALYPCLAATVEAVTAKSAAGRALKMAFGRMGDEQAADLEAKLKRQQLAQMKVEARRAELTNMVARAFLGSMDIE